MIAALYRRWVEAICRAPRRAALLLALACVPATYFTALYFMNVHAELQELLPPESPSVKALQELHRRIGGVSNLVVIASSPDGEVNRRFIAELAGRLEARRIPEAKAIRWNVGAERDWIERRAALLLPRSRFDQILDRVDQQIEAEKRNANPLLVDLEDEEPEDGGWAQIAAELDAEAKANDRFPRGYLETADGTMVVLLVALRGSEVDIGPAKRLAGAVQAEIDQIRGGYPAELVVAFNGEVQNLIEEHAAIVSDVSVSTVLVMTLVGALITIFFRSTRAVLAVVLVLIPGLLFAFALGRLSGSVLNSNSAFLGSLLAGNGINYPLFFFAYYRLRPKDEPMPAAIAAAAAQAFPGAFGASLTSAAAYGGLAAATFRGFSDFGLLGGIGMLMVCVVAFAIGPLALVLFRPPRLGPQPTPIARWLESYYAPGGPSRRIAALVLAVIGAGAAYGVSRAVREGFYDMNLLNLRSIESQRSGSASWDQRVAALFGVWLNPVIGLAEEPSQREALAASLRSALLGGEDPLVERVETIERYVPPLDDQQHRLARLRRLEQTLDRVSWDRVPASARPHVERWLAPENLTPIAAPEVPPILTLGFTERDGRVDRIALVYPSLAIDYNDGNNVVRFAEKLEAAQLPKDTTVAGSFLFMAAIIDLVRAEAPRVVIVVALLVALALVPIFHRRPARIPFVVGSIAVVALSAQALMFAVGVQLNMLNFAAIPITIGVGIDYMVNLFGAMDAYKSNARDAVVRMGGAILLCSLTTLVGYFTLLLAHSGALRSFGWAALLGELMSAGIVLVVLPVVLARSLRVASKAVDPGVPAPHESDR